MRIIAGQWKSRRLATVRGRGVRPTTDRIREAWMSILGDRIGGAVVVDLFAGSGALGLEALSRGAAHVTFVERSRGAIRVLERNVRTLDAGAAVTVIRGDAMAHVRAAKRFRYDLALADPPYDRGYTRALLALFDQHPFAREFWLEHAAGDAVPSGMSLQQRRYGDTTLTGAAPTAGRARREAAFSNSLTGGGTS
ncbi:MAG: 16S rRNA (guanine(966)-N(2))-methyltransferase RsmD [Gemmatimonadetes bacterium]|nr:16S rRNA (guanine(966)-N(2))-methyltransferase RsmD [Gemmatimonadota bacterium]MYE94761.1 16S rRNA (guanine(966)-N(2))-methyltransferase RsmD [Gemmatimonadota bacterium]MYJ10685.1 16S rRNA (guanine(966)-N(2))-methyltransferase RsmD [Gemmatimonadota bacterium]